MTRPWMAVLGAVVAASSLITGCATAPKSAPQTAKYRTVGGTMVWMDEFQFRPPPEPWKLVEVDEGDEFAFAFIKTGKCPFPCESTFAYDEEPFGYSLDLNQRMDEFYRRFLWASHVKFAPAEKHKVEVLGGPGLAATAEGLDPVLGEKVWTKVVLGKRGERVVSFYLAQWRRMDGTYDEQERADFDRFVDSFRFLKKSFYETL